MQDVPGSPLSVIVDDVITFIKRFKFSELEDAVLPAFPEISWNNLRRNLARSHSTFTTINASKLIKKALIDAQITQKELKDRLHTLELIHVSQHNRKRLWYGYMLTHPTTTLQHHLVNEEIEYNIIQYFESSNVRMSVKIHGHDGITYVSLKEQKRRNKNARPLPVIFALFLDQKHFFCSKHNAPKDFINAIATSMGYEKYKRLKLMGRDLISLSTLCWNKKQGAAHSGNIDSLQEYEDGPPVFNNTGIDFTQQKRRRKYAEKCFGENPPTLELLVINGPDQPWSNEVMSSRLPDEKVHTTWEFRSHNMATFLTNLIERRILVPPVPYYISNLMTLGKNQIQLCND